MSRLTRHFLTHLLKASAPQNDANVRCYVGTKITVQVPIYYNALDDMCRR